MKSQPFTPPKFYISAFNCPHCGAYSNQLWGTAHAARSVAAVHGAGSVARIDGIDIGWCSHCGQNTIWVSGKLIFPESLMAPPPNQDLPEEVKCDYEEASSIINKSPRGAAALLRLCIQKLCKALGETGKNINNDIASLVKKGLNPSIQKSLDIVRVIGNDAVHPGAIDIKDDPETAIILCRLINIIAETMITQPKLIEGLYSSLPDDKRIQIDKRDSSV